MTGLALFGTGTGGQRSHGVLIHQSKQIAFVHHVQEVSLILFLILVDGRIVVDHDIEGVAVFRLNGDELLVGGFVIQQVAGGGVALIVNRFPCGKRLCVRLRFRHFLRLRGLGHGKILLGVIRVGKGGQGEAANQHSTERQHGKHTDSFSLTHSQIPPSQ